jgi:hypothetical protein
MDQPHAWLSREPSDLSGLEPDSLLWLSFETPPITRASLPRLFVLITFWSEWTQSRWSPLSLHNIPLECIIGFPQYYQLPSRYVLLKRCFNWLYMYHLSPVPCFLHCPDNCCYLFSNWLCLIIVVIVHYSDTENVSKVFRVWSLINFGYTLSLIIPERQLDLLYMYMGFCTVYHTPSRVNCS